MSCFSIFIYFEWKSDGCLKYQVLYSDFELFKYCSVEQHQWDQRKFKLEE